MGLKVHKFEVVRSFETAGDKLFKRNRVFEATSVPFVKNMVEMLRLTLKDGEVCEVPCEFVKFFEEEVPA